MQRQRHRQSAGRAAELHAPIAAEGPVRHQLVVAGEVEFARRTDAGAQLVRLTVDRQGGLQLQAAAVTPGQPGAAPDPVSRQVRRQLRHPHLGVGALVAVSGQPGVAGNQAELQPVVCWLGSRAGPGPGPGSSSVRISIRVRASVPHPHCRRLQTPGPKVGAGLELTAQGVLRESPLQPRLTGGRWREQPVRLIGGDPVNGGGQGQALVAGEVQLPAGVDVAGGRLRQLCAELIAVGKRRRGGRAQIDLQLMQRGLPHRDPLAAQHQLLTRARYRQPGVHRGGQTRVHRP